MNTFAKKLFYFFPVLFCFLLPFGTIYLAPLIMLWMLSSFFNLDRQQLMKGFKDPSFISLVLFFVLTVLSAVLSDNKKEALFSIEVKLSFVLFPYLLFCFKWPLAILKRCVISFVSGCFFASLFLILRAFMHSMNGEPEYFFYSLFSYFLHASYFAMYLVLAIILVLIFYEHWFRSQKSIIYSSYFFIVIFTATIFLCSSKLGLISFLICIPLTLFYKYKLLLTPKKIFVIILLFSLAFASTAILFPGLFNRFNAVFDLSQHQIDKTSSESTQVRVLIWQEAIDIIKQNFIFGTGVGDANDALYKAYEQDGLSGAFEHRFNAHNQFFQTFIGMGIIGFSMLLYLTIGKLIRGFRSGNFLMMIFALMISLNFAVESMLQTAAGVLFFVFFSALFDLINEAELKTQNDLID